jgi:hypothetical protein
MYKVHRIRADETWRTAYRRQAVGRFGKEVNPMTEPFVSRHAHPAVVRSSSDLYRWHLEDLDRERGGHQLKPLIDLLRSRKGDVSSTPSREWFQDQFKALGGDLIDEFSLGIGWDGAPIVVMGTEAADAATAEDMAFQAVYPALLEHESAPELLRAAFELSPSWDVGDWSVSRRPYHLNPNDYIGVQRKGGRHTWMLVAAAVSSRPAELLGGSVANPGLGERVYQIERSAAISKTAAGGRPPSPARTLFLCREVLPALRQTARVLLMHGFGAGDQRAWEERSAAMATAFLGTQVSIHWQKTAGTWIEEQVHDRRLFLWCRALSGSVSNDYLEQVRQRVLEFAPETA